MSNSSPRERPKKNKNEETSNCFKIAWQQMKAGSYNVFAPIFRIEQITVVTFLLAYIAWNTDTTLHHTLVATNRAWIEPGRIQVLGDLKKGSTTISFVVRYTNSGKEPATNLVIQVPLRVVDPPTDGNNWYSVFVGKNETCASAMPNENGLVIYPGSPDSILYPNQKIPNVEDVWAGRKSLVIEGCIGYQTFGKPRYSAFCYYIPTLDGGESDVPNFRLSPIRCISHNHAT